MTRTMGGLTDLTVHTPFDHCSDQNYPFLYRQIGRFTYNIKKTLLHCDIVTILFAFSLFFLSCVRVVDCVCVLVLRFGIECLLLQYHPSEIFPPFILLALAPPLLAFRSPSCAPRRLCNLRLALFWKACCRAFLCSLGLLASLRPPTTLGADGDGRTDGHRVPVNIPNIPIYHYDFVVVSLCV